MVGVTGWIILLMYVATYTHNLTKYDENIMLLVYTYIANM